MIVVSSIFNINTLGIHVFTYQTLYIILVQCQFLYMYCALSCLCYHVFVPSSSVVTARLPSGDDPIEKLEKGGNTPQQSAKCVLHALKAVRDGEDPASAIKNFVNHCKTTADKPTKEVDAEAEIQKLSSDISKIVVSEGAATTPDTPADLARSTEVAKSADLVSVEEFEALKEENEKLKLAFEAMQGEHQAKIRECKSLTQERDRLSKF